MDLSHVQFEGRPTLRRRLNAPAPVSTLTLPRGGPGLAPRDSGGSGLPAIVLARAGLDHELYRRRPLDRRTGACLRMLRADSEAGAVARLDARPELLGAALNTLLIGVSGFFRDSAVFETLRTAVIPDFAERPRHLRIWSLGCSLGAELYSVAMLLAEAGLLENSSLVGTDCRSDAVAMARAGIFSNDDVAGIDRRILGEYFERTREGWRIAERLRRHTEWRVGDATREMPAGSWDLVLCRNVVIYLQVEALEKMFREIVSRLSPGGFLVVGKAERPSPSLGLTPVGRCVYRTHADD